MQMNAHDLPQYLVLALEHHKQLIKDAHRHRQVEAAMRQPVVERPMRWRRLRSYVGDLLIHFGQRLKAGAANRSTDAVWG